jgi:hypothetical protein
MAHTRAGFQRRSSQGPYGPLGIPKSFTRGYSMRRKPSLGEIVARRTIRRRHTDMDLDVKVDTS